jgi:hypothetical protein
MKKELKSKYEFDESLISPPISFEERHAIIEGKNGVDERINTKKKKKKLSADQLNDYWWQSYREILNSKGYSIKDL